MEDEDWTLRELVERVGAALQRADVRAPNGRVTEVPDARVIRWYATIGLVDRPSAMRGRTALYGRRHLLQLVAIKRLQAQGHGLAEIQLRLTGATDASLRTLSDLPVRDAVPEDVPPVRDAVSEDVPPAYERTGMGVFGGDAAKRSRRFWTQVPTVEPGAVLTGVPLNGGAILLLPAAPRSTDLADIEAAAQPLLDLLTARGLLNPTGRESHDDDR